MTEHAHGGGPSTVPISRPGSDQGPHASAVVQHRHLPPGEGILTPCGNPRKGPCRCRTRRIPNLESLGFDRGLMQRPRVPMPSSTCGSRGMLVFDIGFYSRSSSYVPRIMDGILQLQPTRRPHVRLAPSPPPLLHLLVLRPLLLATRLPLLASFLQQLRHAFRGLELGV